ncbi:hypothetical protein CRENBAI_012637, partial [Crenichthys baileyi]
MLDHLFAEYWTIYTLLDTTRPSDIIGHFASSIVRHYESQWALRLLGRGRPKSDVTRSVTSDVRRQALKPCFQLEISTDYHATEASSGEEEVPRGQRTKIDRSNPKFNRGTARNFQLSLPSSPPHAGSPENCSTNIVLSPGGRRVSQVVLTGEHRTPATEDDGVFCKGMKVGLVMVKDGEEIVDVSVVLEEAVVLTDLKDIPSAVAMLMGLLYCLNIDYPKNQKYTFEMIQTVFMNIGGGQCSSLVHGLRNRLLRKTMRQQGNVILAVRFANPVTEQEAVVRGQKQGQSQEDRIRRQDPRERLES